MGNDKTTKSEPVEGVVGSEISGITIPSDTEKPADTTTEQTEGTEAANAESGKETGTLLEWFNDPVETPMSGLVWAGLGIAVGVLLTVAVMLITSWFRDRKKKETNKITAELGKPAVEKLHEQGARESQQDSFFVSQEDLMESRGLLAVVADGMGGLANGDRTSQAAVSAMANGFYTVQGGTPDQALQVLLGKANQAVNLLLGPEGVYRSGSTLVAGLVYDRKFHYLSVGDSRICLYRAGVLYQLNREHVLRNELTVRAVNGEIGFQDVEKHPKAAGLTSFLGMGRLKYVDLPTQAVQILPGDKFILMSDGVYNALSEQEMISALEINNGGAAEALNEMIRAKNYANQDNYTAVILRF